MLRDDSISLDTATVHPAQSDLTPIIAAISRVVFRGEPPLAIHLWDGTVIPGTGGPEVVRITSPSILTELLWAPGEMGLARSYVKGYVEIVGDAPGALRKLRTGRAWSRDGLRDAAAATVCLLRWVRQVPLHLTRRPDPPTEEARLVGRRHSRRRDRAAIAHHYDVGNDFYSHLLGPTMTYTCADFRGASTLEEAQINKLDLVAGKLRLGGDGVSNLLDVGCGWGSMALHAAERYGTNVVAVTNSHAQADWTETSVLEAGLSDLIEVRLTDYRDLSPRLIFDSISSIGMSEAVGREHMGKYFARLASHLRPRGRLLNHAISGHWRRPGSRSFAHRYIFPDGDVVDVSSTIRQMEASGLRVLDVEAIGHNYAPTLLAWLDNLENNWAEIVALVGERRARSWRLYLAGVSNSFLEGRLDVHQVLGERPG